MVGKDEIINNMIKKIIDEHIFYKEILIIYFLSFKIYR